MILSNKITPVVPLLLILVTTGPAKAQNAFLEPSLATATQIVLESHVSGAPFTWVDNKSGQTGTVTPVRTFKTKTGLFCRDYEIRTDDGGAENRSACRSQGVWIEINSP